MGSVIKNVYLRELEREDVKPNCRMCLESTQGPKMDRWCSSMNCSIGDYVLPGKRGAILKKSKADEEPQSVEFIVIPRQLRCDLLRKTGDYSDSEVEYWCDKPPRADKPPREAA